AAGEVLGLCRSSFTRPFASAVTVNRLRALFPPPLPEPCWQLSKHTALQFPEVSGIRRLAFRLPRPSCSGQPAPLRPVDGFPVLGLLWGLRHLGARAREAIVNFSETVRISMI